MVNYRPGLIAGTPCYSPSMDSDLKIDEWATDDSIGIFPATPSLAMSLPSFCSNHCLATARHVKFDMVAPVTKPPLQSGVNPSKSRNNAIVCSSRIVIVNLVNNAVKYSPNAAEVVVLVQQQGDKASVSVTDKGLGIEESKIPHLFDRYYRASYAGLQFSGLGLGLYICENIIKLHEGIIGVISTPGAGSTFWFNIPITGTEL